MSSFDPEWLSFEEANPIIVPGTLKNLHPMTAKISLVGFGDQPRPVGGRENSWRLNAFKIAVSDASIERATRIVDALAKACDTRGFKWGNTQHESIGLSVVVDGECIALALSERMARSPYRPTKQEVARQRRGEYVYRLPFALFQRTAGDDHRVGNLPPHLARRCRASAGVETPSGGGTPA
jgi:hypothetical protein